MSKHRKGGRRPSLGIAVDAMDDIEPALRHLIGLVTALRILGAADDSVEPIAISSIARCAGTTLDEIEQSWRTAIGALRIT